MSKFKIKCKRIVPVKYITLKELLRAYIQFGRKTDITDEVLYNSKIDICLNSKKTPYKIAYNQLKKIGCWGWCCWKEKHPEIKEIHFWVSKTCKDFDLYELIGHELSHAYFEANENSASNYGLIASMSQVFIERNNK